MVKPHRESSRSRRRASSPADTLQESQSTPGISHITATIDAATGKIVEVTALDDAGAPAKLTSGRRAGLSKQSGEATIEDLFEQVFEAGIASVLGDDADEGDADESEEDVSLRHQILRQMIEHSAAQRLMRKEVLGRAIVGTLIQKAARDRDTSSRARSSAAA